MPQMITLDDHVESLKCRLTAAYESFSNDGDVTTLISELAYVGNRAIEIKCVAESVDEALENL